MTNKNWKALKKKERVYKTQVSIHTLFYEKLGI